MKQILTLVAISALWITLPFSCRPVAWYDGLMKARQDNQFNKYIMKVYKDYDKQFVKQFDPEAYTSREQALAAWREPRENLTTKKYERMKAKVEKWNEKLSTKYEDYDKSRATLYKSYNKHFKRDRREALQQLAKEVPDEVQAAILQIPCSKPDEEMIRQMMADKSFHATIDQERYVDISMQNYAITDVKIGRVYYDTDTEYSCLATLTMKHKRSDDRTIVGEFRLTFLGSPDNLSCWRLGAYEDRKMSYVPSEKYLQFARLVKEADGFVVYNDSDENLMVVMDYDDDDRDYLRVPAHEYVKRWTWTNRKNARIAYVVTY